MHRYLLSIIQPTGSQPPPNVLAGIMRDVAALTAEMQEAGAWVMAAGLEPPSMATVVRVRDGRSYATDGPFAETKEQLGGFTIVESPSRAAAVEWGRRLAVATTLPVEVRALQDAPHEPPAGAGVR
jgi:hypothetical protein